MHGLRVSNNQPGPRSASSRKREELPSLHMATLQQQLQGGPPTNTRVRMHPLQAGAQRDSPSLSKCHPQRIRHITAAAAAAAAAAAGGTAGVAAVAQRRRPAKRGSGAGGERAQLSQRVSSATLVSQSLRRLA